MDIPYFHIDAFTSKVHHGNPAGVCLLDYWLEKNEMQKIAAENNLSETAFLVKVDSHYEIRWFTPTSEINLCGHATLASGFVIFNFLNLKAEKIEFISPISGTLSVEKESELLLLNFPSIPPKPCETPSNINKAFGKMPVEVLAADDYLLLFESEKELLSLNLNFEEIKKFNLRGVIVTSRGTDCDFVSRFFCPKFGINEDPVTGSAHCTLIPYWKEKLKKNHFFAKQISERSGELFCKDNKSRVTIGGNAVCYMQGKVTI